MKLTSLLITTLMLSSLPAFAADKSVTMHAINEDGVGKIIGTLRLKDSEQGLIIATDLAELTPGEHGFHIHENPNCDAKEKDGKKVAGLGAGGHYDPAHSGKHQGPIGAGHAGDLPALIVAADGSAKGEVVAPRLRIVDVTDRTVIIHAGSDNYSDSPKPLGGGGARIACGVIE